MPIELSQNDINTAETFLETLLTENVENGRFTEGSALRDLVIKSFAFVFAQMQKEKNEIRSLQSLLNVENIAVSDPDTSRAVRSAVDAILSNWFITRNSGAFSRGNLIVNVSRRQDYIVPGNQRFAYDRQRAFYPDIPDPSQNIVIRSNDLTPVIATDGTVEAYQFKLRVVAARTGDTFDVAPATWLSGGQFSPFVTSIFNDVRFSGGKARETTEELIDRAETAVAVRNLINPRSIDATLKDQFPSVQRLKTVGMGEEEMLRDYKSDLGSGIELHVGGHFDVYVELPRVETTFEGVLGGVFTRPDGIANVFRDESSVSDWTTTDVAKGDIIRISSGIPNAPKDFTIKEIYETELRVSDQFPFPTATDEDGAFVEYFIYRPVFGPDKQILPASGVNTTGQTSKKIHTDNRIVLPGGAHYDILDVAVIDPDPGDPNISGVDGYVHFPIRVNETPSLVISSDSLEYQIINANPGSAQSQIQMEELEIESTYNNKTIRVEYETLSGLESLHSFTRGRFERILAANVLVKGFVPIYLSFTLPYRLKPTADDTVDNDALIEALIKHINTFDPNDVIDVSDLSLVARNFDSNIGAVLPFTVTYDLIAPDGRQITYSTTDQVTLDSSLISSGDTLDDPLSIGVSDRTVKYLTNINRVDVEERE